MLITRLLASIFLCTIMLNSQASIAEIAAAHEDDDDHIEKPLGQPMLNPEIFIVLENVINIHNLANLGRVINPFIMHMNAYNQARLALARAMEVMPAADRPALWDSIEKAQCKRAEDILNFITSENTSLADLNQSIGELFILNDGISRQLKTANLPQAIANLLNIINLTLKKFSASRAPDEFSLFTDAAGIAAGLFIELIQSNLRKVDALPPLVSELCETLGLIRPYLPHP